MTDRWTDFVSPDFNKDFGPSQISFWQLGCNDAKAGKPADPRYRDDYGYMNGFGYGQGNPRSLARPVLDTLEEDSSPRPDPPLKNPYMEGIEAIEGIVNRLRHFHREFPGEFAVWQKDEYLTNLLKVRDELHEMVKEDAYGE